MNQTASPLALPFLMKPTTRETNKFLSEGFDELRPFQNVVKNFKNLVKNFTDEDKLLKINYNSICFSNNRSNYFQMANDSWLLKMAVLSYMRKEKRGETEPPTQEEIAQIRNQYSNNKVYYTEPIEDKDVAKENEIE